jgi:hypothetical protein
VNSLTEGGCKHASAGDISPHDANKVQVWLSLEMQSCKLFLRSNEWLQIVGRQKYNKIRGRPQLASAAVLLRFSNDFLSQCIEPS